MFINARIEKTTKWTPKNINISNSAQTHKMYVNWGKKIYLS